MIHEEHEDTKGVIRICKSKDRQTEKGKRTTSDQQNNATKTEQNEPFKKPVVNLGALDG
jgi:hypothetical protein